MHSKTMAPTLGVRCGLTPLVIAQSPPQVAALSEQDAHALGVDASLFFSPLVPRDLPRKQCTHIESGKELGKSPMHTFVHLGT